MDNQNSVPVPDLSPLMDIPSPLPPEPPQPLTPQPAKSNRGILILLALFFFISLPVLALFVTQRNQIADIRNRAEIDPGQCNIESDVSCVGKDPGSSCEGNLNICNVVGGLVTSPRCACQPAAGGCTKNDDCTAPLVCDIPTGQCRQRTCTEVGGTCVTLGDCSKRGGSLMSGVCGDSSGIIVGECCNLSPGSTNTPVPTTNVPPTNVPPTNVPPTNVPPTNVPPSNTPTRTPTSTIAPPTSTPVVGRCVAMKIYRAGVAIVPSTVRPGDSIVIALVGNHSSITGARIKINSETTWREEFTRKNAAGEWIFDYTVPLTGVTSISITGQLLIGQTWQ